MKVYRSGLNVIRFLLFDDVLPAWSLGRRPSWYQEESALDFFSEKLRYMYAVEILKIKNWMSKDQILKLFPGQKKNASLDFIKLYLLRWKT